ncbi:MFS transporter [Frankia sp. AgKG'84/4]|uniref:MFS transporter n=1 Tax=Frankia sp. AgKG'84/4 TaxID=573490 RepID=UPI00200DF2A6|nr:MFS transporter [Frankia sp. AgKG'84/4]MCL9794077.1 MFS transporter [Frankia sp. AgKG'84/4]
MIDEVPPAPAVETPTSPVTHDAARSTAARSTAARPGVGISRSLVFLLAVTTGLSVAAMYYAQPLLDEVRDALGLSTGTAGLLVTVTQAGYLAALILLVPVGDLLARRRLIPALVAAQALALVLLASAHSATQLMIAGVAVGALSVTAQIGVAFAASLADDADRGRVVGTVMSGLLLGILLARTVAGWLADLGGWRTPYWVAGAVQLVLCVVLALRLPAEPQAEAGRPSYRQAVASVPKLLREEPLLRRRALYGAASFGAFSVLWTPLSFLLSDPPYGYSTAIIGLFGLLGLMGVLAASLAGRAADRGRAGQVSAATSALLLVAWLPLALGEHWLAGLVVGILVLDLAAQGLHITNQSEIYRLRPEARSRLTAAYMATYFTGGLAGSLAATTAYSAGGWTAVSLTGAAFGLAALALVGWDILAARRG